MKFKLFRSAVVMGALVALASIQSGCGHDASIVPFGFTTVHIGGAAESMQAARNMNFMERLSTPEMLTPVPAGGGIIVFAQQQGGGGGAIWVTPGSSASWTLPNGTYNFSAVGYDGVSGTTMAYNTDGPYCGLALGDSGVRGTTNTLAGVSTTVDILMGTTPFVTAGVGTGPSGSAAPGTTSAPTCGMTPFMTPDGLASGCTTGTNTCFVPKLQFIGVCTSTVSGGAAPGLPAGSNITSGSGATSCGGLQGPAGNTSAAPVNASGILAVMIQIAPYNSFATNGSGSPPSLPFPTSGTLSSSCIGVTGGTTTAQLPLWPIGGGNTAVGGPAMFNATYVPSFASMTTISLFADAACTSWKRTYFFPYGVSSSYGSTGFASLGAPSYVLNQYVDASSPSVYQSADQLTGYWTSGTTEPAAGKLWIQYP